MIIRASNQLDNNSPYSYVSSSLASGVTTVPVKNINAFQANWAIQLGKTGEELAEIVLLGTATPSGTAVTTTTATRYAHPTDTPVYAIKYNQIIFMRSVTGTAGTAYDMTDGTVAITPDSEYTQIDDPQGSATYAYKARFRNSVLGVGYDSPDSDWITPSGFTFYSLAKLRSRVKEALFSAGYIKYESSIDDWINEWVEQMTNSAIKVNQGYAMGTTSVAFGTAGLGTITVSDFKQPRKVEITYDGVSYENSTEIPLNRFSESDSFTSVYPQHSWNGDTTFQVRPQSTGGTARISYYALGQKLTNDTDELTLTLRGYTTGCIEYALYRAYDNDEKHDTADRHYGKFVEQKSNFISEITPRDLTGPKVIDLVEELSGRTDDLEYFS